MAWCRSSRMQNRRRRLPVSRFRPGISLMRTARNFPLRDSSARPPNKFTLGISGTRRRGGIGMTRRFDDLTVATTVQNNIALCVAMLRSFDANIGTPAGVIVIDDASEMPPHFPTFSAPVFTLRNQTAAGFCKAADRALREVQTKYALLVDADVVFEPGDFNGGYSEFKKNNWAWANFRQTNFEGQPQDSFEHPLLPPWA